MRRPIVRLVTVAVMIALSVPLRGQQAALQSGATFRSNVNLILVDVVVRDRSGAVVQGLTQDDFQILEDNKPQQIISFAFEQIATKPQTVETAPLLAGAVNAAGAPRVASTAASTPVAPVPLTSEDVAGHRLWTLLFDTSSMQPEEVQKAADSALTWVNDQMGSSDLVAVATIGSTLQVLSDFTNDKERVKAVLGAFTGADATQYAAVDASTGAADEAASAEVNATTVDESAQELDTFNNDVRLRALKTLADALAPVQQKKAILYFSSGMQRNGTDNQIELRAAVNAAVRANVTIYPVDARGLQAVVPGGSARQGSRGGVGAFSGQAVGQQFGSLIAQQETLTTLASDTGGRAFLDSNDFGEAFAQVERDISSYYIIGYASTNANRDGRYRRITVRVKDHPNVRIEARNGYYADRDFAHTSKGDREQQLQDQLAVDIPSTDVPLFVTAGWFRLAADRYYVPLSVAVPGTALTPSTNKVMLDVAGVIRDERGAAVGRIRDTMMVPAASTSDLAARQVLYQTGVTLPPGRFSAKIVVRENTTGQMGTFEAAVVVPELRRAPVKVSSIVLSTQLQSVANRKTVSPLVQAGGEFVPNLTHVVSRAQKLYFYYEVYDPAQDAGMPDVRTSLTFYRGKVKVFETPTLDRTQVDATDRHAAVFQFEVPAGSLTPGLYTCQVNIVDEVAGQFVFPRVELYVR
jgi:VWFA-related protein